MNALLTRSPIAITGIGLQTALGRSAGDTWSALLTGQRIVEHHRLDASGDSNHSRAARLGTAAAKEAIADAGWKRPGGSRGLLIIASSKGPVESWLTPPPYMRFSPCIEGGSCSFGLSGLADEIAGALDLRAWARTTISAACASGLHALIYAAMRLASGEADRALVIGAEASVHPLFLASFTRLGVLAKPGEPCRPLDRDRDGFLMADAGAAICLERSGGAVVLDRFALAGDASHLTGADADGATLTRVLREVVAGDPVDLFHAHATGTHVNDPIELAAIELSCPAESPPTTADKSHPQTAGDAMSIRTIPDNSYPRAPDDAASARAIIDNSRPRTTDDATTAWANIDNSHAPTAGDDAKPASCAVRDRPLVYSHKGALGHSLGAAGVVATALTVLAHRRGEVPGNVGVTHPLATDRVSIPPFPTRRAIRRSITCAAGFGGALGAIRLTSQR